MMTKDQIVVLVWGFALAYLVFTEPLRIASGAALALYAAGFGLGVWAIWTMRASKLRIMPQVAHGSTLIMHGPYKFIRHPMYAALLVLTIGTLLNSAPPDRILAVAVLWVCLFIKIQIEEKHLHDAFDDYEYYASHTKKLIPFVY